MLTPRWRTPLHLVFFLGGLVPLGVLHAQDFGNMLARAKTEQETRRVVVAARAKGPQDVAVVVYALAVRTAVSDVEGDSAVLSWALESPDIGFVDVFERLGDWQAKAMIAGAVNNLGVKRYQQGNVNEAEKLLGKAFELFQRGRGSPTSTPPAGYDIAFTATLTSLSNLYDKQGRYGEAIDVYARYLDILESIRGPEHCDLVTSLDAMAELQKKNGDLSAAERLGSRAAAIKSKSRC